MRPGGEWIPSRAGASGSHHLPWALPRVLQFIANIKRLAGGSDWHAGGACGGVCSKGASSAFILGGAPALLQRALPGGGAEMVTVEGAAALPDDGAGPTETKRPKPALPGTRQSRKPAEPEAVNDPARVITKEHFFDHSCNRPSGYHAIREGAAKSPTSFLLTRLPARWSAL